MEYNNNKAEIPFRKNEILWTALEKGKVSIFKQRAEEKNIYEAKTYQEQIYLFLGEPDETKSKNRYYITFKLCGKLFGINERRVCNYTILEGKDT